MFFYGTTLSVVMKIEWIHKITSDGVLTSYIYHELQCISMYLNRIPMLLEPKHLLYCQRTHPLRSPLLSSPLRLLLLLLFPPERSVPEEYRIDQWVSNNKNNKARVKRLSNSKSWTHICFAFSMSNFLAFKNLL